MRVSWAKKRKVIVAMVCGYGYKHTCTTHQIVDHDTALMFRAGEAASRKWQAIELQYVAGCARKFDRGCNHGRVSKHQVLVATVAAELCSVFPLAKWTQFEAERCTTQPSRSPTSATGYRRWWMWAAVTWWCRSVCCGGQTSYKRWKKEGRTLICYFKDTKLCRALDRLTICLYYSSYMQLLHATILIL